VDVHIAAKSSGMSQADEDAVLKNVAELLQFNKVNKAWGSDSEEILQH